MQLHRALSKLGLASRTQAWDRIRAGEVSVNGRRLELTPSEFELLAILMAAPGRVFSRQDLLMKLAHYDGAERTVDVHVKNLRSKLEPEQCIETVFGVGYRFRVPEPAA